MHNYVTHTHQPLTEADPVGYFFMPSEKYTKSALNLDAQLELLAHRGLLIPDPKLAYQCLANVGYYRLSTYFRPFETNVITHQFYPNITFNHIESLYEFDRKLRLLVLDAIERVEVALRAALSNILSLQYGPMWYMKEQIFKANWRIKPSPYKKSPYERFQQELTHICEHPQETFIKQYYQRYEDPKYPPIWMIMECLSFGNCISLFRSLAHTKDQKNIAATFKQHYQILISAFEAIRYTRNICAHHARLWDRWFVVKPRTITESKNLDCQPHTFKEQATILYLLHHAICPDSSWSEHLYQLFAQYHKNIPFEKMGFYTTWQSDPFWEFAENLK